MTRKLMIASLVLAIFSFSSCENATKNTTAKSEATATENTTNTLKIAYFEVDSVVKHYKLFIDLNNTYNKKAEKVKTELEKKATKFQKKLETFQREIQNGLITRTKAMEKEQKLQTEQQELIQYRDAEFAKLSEEEQVMGNKISYNLKQYVQNFNKDFKYDLILSTSMGNATVVSGNPKLNISNEIIEGLNKEYEDGEKEDKTTVKKKK